MTTPHVCPKCKAEKPAVARCHPCKGTGILWEPSSEDEAFTKLADAIGKLLPLTPAVPQVVPVPMPYPVYPQPDYPGVPVYPTDPTYRPMTTRPIWTDRTLPVWIGEVSQTIGVSTSSTGWTGGIHGQA